MKRLFPLCLLFFPITLSACNSPEKPRPTAETAKPTATVPAETTPIPPAEPKIDAVYTREDSAEVVILLRECPKGRPADVLFFARSFIGRPYVAHTLEGNREEQLVVDLRRLDCTTLVETVTALVMTHRQEKTAFRDFCHNLELIRYGRSGRNGYCSRLHYFGWWIHENERRGIVDVISDPQVFTATKRLNVSYMSVHPEKYEALRRVPARKDSIRSLEQRYNGLSFPVLPKQKTGLSAQALSAIEEGDIIAIATSKKGLDYAHLGFATRDNLGRLHLLNASSIYKKVVDDGDTLLQYLNKHSSFTGVTILRIK